MKEIDTEKMENKKITGKVGYTFCIFCEYSKGASIRQAELKCSNKNAIVKKGKNNKWHCSSFTEKLTDKTIKNKMNSIEKELVELKITIKKYISTIEEIKKSRDIHLNYLLTKK